jgi:hypothetical protein
MFAFFIEFFGAFFSAALHTKYVCKHTLYVLFSRSKEQKYASL